eukprot:XP_014041116.1 PREDICTED: uncharacterized protein LOC106594268 [Salmo salar]
MFPSVWWIVGIVAGAVVAFAAFAVLLYFCRKQRNKLKKEAKKNRDLQTKLDEEENIRQHVEKKVVGFLDARRPKLVDNVTKVMPIADALKSMIQEQRYRNISAAETNVEKMNLLFAVVDSGGEEVKSAFYKSLMKEEPDLVLDMLKAEPDRVINLLGEELGIYPNTDVVDHPGKAEEEVLSGIACQHRTQRNISQNESGRDRVEMMEMQPLLGPGSETVGAAGNVEMETDSRGSGECRDGDRQTVGAAGNVEMETDRQ